MKLKHEAFFEKLADKIRSDAAVQRAYGEPIEFEGRKIIPVARVSYRYAFGEGGGPGIEEAKDQNVDEYGLPMGGYGIGAMSSARPVGVIDIGPQGAAFIPVRPRRELVRGIVFGVLAALVLTRLLRR
jgi:uncharacterized spore protein YtfJ